MDVQTLIQFVFLCLCTKTAIGRKSENQVIDESSFESSIEPIFFENTNYLTRSWLEICEWLKRNERNGNRLTQSQLEAQINKTNEINKKSLNIPIKFENKNNTLKLNKENIQEEKKERIDSKTTILRNEWIGMKKLSFEPQPEPKNNLTNITAYNFHSSTNSYKQNRTSTFKQNNFEFMRNYSLRIYSSSTPIYREIAQSSEYEISSPINSITKPYLGSNIFPTLTTKFNKAEEIKKTNFTTSMTNTTQPNEVTTSQFSLMTEICSNDQSTITSILKNIKDFQEIHQANSKINVTQLNETTIFTTQSKSTLKSDQPSVIIKNSPIKSEIFQKNDKNTKLVQRENFKGYLENLPSNESISIENTTDFIKSIEENLSFNQTNSFSKTTRFERINSTHLPNASDFHITSEKNFNHIENISSLLTGNVQTIIENLNTTNITFTNQLILFKPLKPLEENNTSSCINQSEYITLENQNSEPETNIHNLNCEHILSALSIEQQSSENSNENCISDTSNQSEIDTSQNQNSNEFCSPLKPIEPTITPLSDTLENSNQFNYSSIKHPSLLTETQHLECQETVLCPCSSEHQSEPTTKKPITEDTPLFEPYNSIPFCKTFDCIPVSVKKITVTLKNISCSRERTHVRLEEYKSNAGFFLTNRRQGVHLFFWFFRTPNHFNAPLIIWLQGEPGWSSLYGLFEEHGPYYVDEDKGCITLRPREYTWVKEFNVLYLDYSPGIGFSIATASKAYNPTFENVGKNVYYALYQFFKIFCEFQQNDLYLAGSYGGAKYLPIIANIIHSKNRFSDVNMKLKGLMIGGPYIDASSMATYSDFLFVNGIIDEEKKDEMEINQNLIKTLINSNKYQQAIEKITHSIYSQIKNAGYQNLYDIRYPIPINGKYMFDSYMTKLVTSDTFKAMIKLSEVKFQTNSNILTEQIMCSVEHLIPQLSVNYKILYYNGQFDIMAPFSMTSQYISRMHWEGANDFYTSTTKNWYTTNTTHPNGYFKSYNNITHVMVRDAGHSVGTTNSESLFYLLKWFIEDKFN